MRTSKGFGLIGWLVTLALIGGAIAGVWYWKQPKETAPEYRTALVEKGELTQAVTATGQLNPVLNVQVGSQISGMIKELYVDYNSRVTKGELIAQIDPSTFQANVHQSEGELANAKAALELAQLNASRSAKLRKENLVSPSEDDKAQADLHQAEAAVKIREASLEKARVDLARCKIYAPVDGQVISRSVDIGQTVAASLSAPTLFVIANDLTKMQIDANVSEADVGGVEVEQDVTFTVDAYPYRTFRGKVKQIRNSPITVQNVVSYDTVIEVNNEDYKLKPGMTANVSIIIAHRANTLKIPNAALRFRPVEPEQKGDRKEVASHPQGSTFAAAGAGGFGGGRSGGPPGAGGRVRERGGAGGGGGPRKAMAEQQMKRTVYVMPAQTEVDQPPRLKPVEVKLGITDGAFTEVIDGLGEKDQLVVGMNSESSAPAGPTANPFSGMRRFH